MQPKTIAAAIAAAVILSANAANVRAGEAPVEAIATPVDESSFYFYGDLWATGIKGDVGIAGFAHPVDASFDDLVQDLDGGLAGGFGYQKGKWGFLTEAIWMKLSTDAPTPGRLFTKADIGVEQVMADGHISYRIFECSADKGYIDLIGGVRYTYIKSTLGLEPGLAPRQINLEGSESWWDVYGGFKGRYKITDKWFIPFRADVGGGGSSLAWQAMAGIGYQVNPLLDIKLGYRYMSVDYSDGGFLYDVDTSGPLLAIGFTF